MTAILGRTGNFVGFTTGRGTTPWNTEMEAALRKMDAMLASTVIAITNTLPGSANEGDLYLVGTAPTGVAAGWANRIARWRNSPAGWEAYPPLEGWIITIVGESTNKVRRYDGTAWVALAVDVGAEPYAGIPAQTSFWRSTAAGVRAWVQLVAADITDLATTLAGYLTKNNPSWTGTMDGGSGATFRMSSLQGGLGNDFVCADMIGFIRKVTPSQALTNMQGMSLALKGAANGVAELGADGRVPSGQLPASLALGETSATAYRGDRGKIAYDHSQATGNPHGTVPSDIGAARAPATYELSGNAGIGTITASAIKVLVDGATISLSLGANGQAWDVICPDYAVEFYVPTGATLYRYSGITTGPATYSPGGGRAIRVVRVDATTWLMPNLS